MTALLILAIAASSALVFTNRVELLKLAVIIALWAAVAAAFVSVIYRRQSDVDQARARDLKLVYDLQLDREISARREYELTVESQLRRELAAELRAQAADEVAALRAELSALRTNLEILFDADLSQRPALETERTTVRAYSDWARSSEQPTTGATRVASSTTPSYPPDSVTETAENPIIDVPEVRIPPTGGSVPPAPQKPQAPHAEGRRGSHRRSADEAPRWTPQEAPPPAPAASRWAQPPQPFVAPESRREPEPPQPPPAPQPAPVQPAPEPQSAPSAPEPQSAPQPSWVASPAASSWKPVGAEGEWLPPGTPGSRWAADVPADAGRHGVSEQQTEAPSRHGRHSSPADSGPVDVAESARHEAGGRRRARSRHAAEPADDQLQPPASPASPVTEPAEPAAPAHAGTPAARHSAGADGSAESPRTGGQSVADLLARLQTTPTEGGRRRRRED
nr:DUF6779 domain-containing protein [Mycolicibacter nonchromogenicus]